MTQTNELDKFKSMRKILRTSLTKIINKITGELAGDEIEYDEIEDCKFQLIENADQVFKLDSDIHKLIDNLDTLEKDVESCQEYREKVTKIKAKIDRHLRRNIANESKSNSSTVLSSGHDELKNISHIHVRLPKLNIEPFDGRHEKWQEFWGQFQVAIHENMQLSNVEKFNYLKNFLKASALRCIQGLALTQENYNIAVELLKERFGKNEIIVRSHVNNLLSLTPVKSCANLRELRQLHDTCIIQIRSLETAGVKLNNYGSILFTILIKLIPEEIVLEYNRSVKDEDSWNCSKLLDYLKHEIETREKTHMFRKNEELERGKIKESSYRKHESYKNTPTASALNTFTKKECIFCSLSDHENSSCPLSINERKSSLLRKGICFNCLKRNHISKFCNSRVRCLNCNRKHNIVICNEIENQTNKTIEKGESVPLRNSNALNCATDRMNSIFLQTAVAFIGNKSQKVKLILDMGSERSFVHASIVRKYNLEIVGREKLSIYAFGSRPNKSIWRNRVKVILRNIHNPQKFVEIEAIEIPCISEAEIPGPSEKIHEFCKKAELQVADIEGSENLNVSLLIGSDYFWKIATGKTKRVGGALVGMETILGYVFNGSEEKYRDFKHVKVMNAVVRNENLEEIDILRNLFELESLGILRSDNLNSEENVVLEEFEKTIKLIEGRYQVQLPWNEHFKFLHDNHSNANTRLGSLIRKFNKNVKFYNQYKDIISRHIAQGIAEVVGKNDTCDDSKIYYMPHHAVIREDKTTTKMRIVFDASSSEANFPSLNDCLSPGPNLTPDILILLLQFRLNKVAIIADIEGAFLQIAIAPEDRNAVRFLWVTQDLKSEPEVLRMTRVIFGARSSSFLLNATIKHHIKKYREIYPDAFNILNSRLYVDDLIHSLEDTDLAYTIHGQVKSILRDAGFNMRKWKTNIHSLQDKFEREGDDESAPCKVLGYCWNSENDVLSVDSDKLLQSKDMKELRFTKRNVIRTIGRIFDPLGLISPFTIRAKMLLQDIWKKKLDWDDILPPELVKIFQDWCEELFYLKEITVPRHIFSMKYMKELTECQFHIFVDASKRAYGAVIYVRFCNSNGEFHSNLVTSKTKVAPVQEITLPRLELLAALIGARLFHHIQLHLNLPKNMKASFWSDSMIVLHWIKNNSRKLKMFVKNRVDEIKKISNPDCWNHCPGNENPADALSRGENIARLKDQELWWFGPSWLRKGEEQWPNSNADDVQEMDLERGEYETVTMLVTTEFEALFNIQRFSKLRKILRITAWIQRFVHNARNHQSKRIGPLSTEELDLAEEYWIKYTQREHFPEEYSALAKGKTIPASSAIKMFNPIFSEREIILIGGRLHQAKISYQEVHPTLLPSMCHLSDLIIKECHERTGHGGVSETLTQLRERIWILRGRQRIKSLIFRCSLCQKLRAKPASQIPAPLPEDRINEAYPFQVTGLDYLGPLYVKDLNENRKTYILLFTCAVTRAVHLELTQDLTTKTFIQAFKKFVGRRGICSIIYSDNAKTFHKAKRELDLLWKIMKNEDVQNLFSGLSIKWKFIVERAAWWGGFWERLVRSVKTSLKRILGRTSVTFHELEVIVVEVEAILNSRPLTYVFSDPHEPEPLTPGHFLIGRRLLTLPQSKLKLPNTNQYQMIKMRKHQENILTQVWKRWKSNYLLELKSAHQCKQIEHPSQIKENTVVLLKDNTPRLIWKMAVVIQTHPGRDGQIRACSLRLPNGVIIRRPVQLLCPLELLTLSSPDAPRPAEVVAN